MIRFRFTIDRNRFLVTRSTLRTILGQYLNTAPARLIFSYGTHGKPEVVSEHNDRALQFNVSHSGDFCLIAITRVGAVGVDIERIRWEADLMSVAVHNFSANEIPCFGILHSGFLQLF